MKWHWGHWGSLAFVAGLVISLTVGWLVFPKALYRQRLQPLQFNHQVHTGDELGMACQDCHCIDAANRFAVIPSVAVCAECHTEPQGDSHDELILVEDYILKGREIPWLIYSKQPDHVYFPHAVHVKVAVLECERCHGRHGSIDAPPTYEENRLTGYSRLIWGHSILRSGLQTWKEKRMGDCSSCHREGGVVESCMDCHK